MFAIFLASLSRWGDPSEISVLVSLYISVRVFFFKPDCGMSVCEYSFMRVCVYACMCVCARVVVFCDHHHHHHHHQHQQQQKQKQHGSSRFVARTVQERVII